MICFVWIKINIETRVNCLQEQTTDGNKKITWTLSRDEHFNFRAVHWADLHSLLYSSLQSDVVLWGHLFLSFRISDDKTYVRVQAKVLQTNETVEIVADLLVAADGCLSSIREAFLPDLKLRFVNKLDCSCHYSPYKICKMIHFIWQIFWLLCMERCPWFFKQWEFRDHNPTQEGISWSWQLQLFRHRFRRSCYSLRAN